MARPSSSRAAAFRKVPLFNEPSAEELDFLAERAIARHYRPGELIFSEGDPCEGLYIIESGSVRIFKTSPSGREQLLGIERAVSSIAELPAFDEGPYPASGAAVEEARLLLIRKRDFQAVCLRHPAVALKVLKVVGARLRQLVGIIEELSFTTVRHRLAALLLRLTRQAGKPETNRIEVTLGMSHQEIATQIGTVRELVSRTLSRLQAEGLIEIEGKTIAIPDVKALEVEVERGE